MKVRSALMAAIEFYEKNDTLSSIEVYVPILMRIINKFGGKDIRDVSMLKIAAFLEKSSGSKVIYKMLAKKKKYFWEMAYFKRYVEQVTSSLPWEDNKPFNLLGEIFKSNGHVPRNVLELGSGTGRDAIFMAEKGSNVTAVDISSIAIKIAKESAKKADVKCKFLNRDIFKMNLKSENFDFIFDRGCFHHVPFILHNEYAQLISKLLSPDGSFYLICHCQQKLPKESFYHFLGKLAWLLNCLEVHQSEILFTPNDIKLIFSDKFKIQKITKHHDETGNNLCCFMRKQI